MDPLSSSPPPSSATDLLGELPPTPIERLAPLWVKRDDLVHPLYGGNKPRKLQRLLALARAQGAERVLTFGAAGSHHVLATALFGRRAGLAVTAVLTPQPRTEHAVEVLRAAHGQGVTVVTAPAWASVLPAVRALRGSFVIPPGGSNLTGVMAYADAVREVSAAVAEGMPAPDTIVVAAGSGGTAAGLAVGVVEQGLGAEVVAVAVARPAAAVGAMVRSLAAAAARRRGVSVRQVLARLRIEAGAVGAGYGHATAEGERATRWATERGLVVDPTYTSKALGVALGLAVGREVLYWHTLSSAPLAPLLAGAPAEDELPAAVRALLTR